MKTLVIALLLLLPGLSIAIEYHGENTLYTDTVWQGEVLIDGTLTLAMGATLEIRPGTIVRFSWIDSNNDGIGESEIFAQGQFIARGSREQPIIFTSAQEHPAAGAWGALNMMMSETGENLLENCLVEYAYRGFHAHFSKARLRNSHFRNNLRAAQFQESTVFIEDSDFVGNFNGLQFRDSKVSIKNSKISANHWGIRAVYVELQMRGNQITENLTNGISLRDSALQLHDNLIADNRRGIYLQRSQGAISGNRILANREHGIYLEDSSIEIQGNLLRTNGRAAFKLLDSGGSIVNNRIENSGEYAISIGSAADFKVGANWYGAAGLKPELLDGRSRQGLGLLHLAPALTKQPKVEIF